MTIYRILVVEFHNDLEKKNSQAKIIKREEFKSQIDAVSFAAFCCRQMEKRRLIHSKKHSMLNKSTGEFVSFWFKREHVDKHGNPSEIPDYGIQLEMEVL